MPPNVFLYNVYAPELFPAIQFWSYTTPSKVSFSAAKSCNFLEKTVNYNLKQKFRPKLQPETAFLCVFLFLAFLSRQSRLSRAACDPTWLIRARPIICDTGPESRWRISRFLEWRQNIFLIGSGTRPSMWVWVSGNVSTRVPKRKQAHSRSFVRYRVASFFARQKVIKLYYFLGEASLYSLNDLGILEVQELYEIYVYMNYICYQYRSCKRLIY